MANSSAAAASGRSTTGTRKRVSFWESQRLAKQKQYEKQARRKNIKLQALTVFTQQLSSMLEAGLPLVSALVLFALQLLGIPLHQMSIFGLIVAIGLLIDNAIVVDEYGVAGGEGSQLVDRCESLPLVGLRAGRATRALWNRGADRHARAPR